MNLLTTILISVHCLYETDCLTHASSVTWITDYGEYWTFGLN